MPWVGQKFSAMVLHQESHEKPIYVNKVVSSTAVQAIEASCSVSNIDEKLKIQI